MGQQERGQDRERAAELLEPGSGLCAGHGPEPQPSQVPWQRPSHSPGLPPVGVYPTARMPMPGSSG